MLRTQRRKMEMMTIRRPSQGSKCPDNGQNEGGTDRIKMFKIHWKA